MSVTRSRSHDAHAGGVQREGQGLARRLDLARALGDAPLQGLVGDPQALLGALALAEVLARLVLAPPRPQRRGDRADQGLGVDRALQQHDVAEALQHGRAPARGAARPGASPA